MRYTSNQTSRNLYHRTTPYPVRGRGIALALFLLLLHASARGQTYLGGYVFLSGDDTPLSGASVRNMTNGRSTLATPAGIYLIEAEPGDVIVFSFTGMTADTMKVRESLLKTGYDVGLQTGDHTLKTVTVISSYQLDSLRRQKEYGVYFKKGRGLANKLGPENAFGLTFSPVSFFSRKARNQRRFRKRLIRDEREAYIDYVFSPGWVSKQTGLKDDSLQQFMYRYRPSYQTARTLDRPAMIAYINNRYKAFMHKPE
ncbi:hypothetical protein B0I18_108136 [Taibaiella chishuiensis]|uniref:Carboxypeptidase-like protein n=1 Tax=Taibaiella chishuiensis TaxID=1434707 RepID=A0A2P8CZQ5_9BACT|nr:hypothetical protein B0I18_108136 [Taibaiella chishuiensis]